METIQNRVCKCCGDRIRGRSDKMYCDDRCRNRFHNKAKKKPGMGQVARTIQHQLMKNRLVLHRHLGERKKCVVDRDRLLRDGFSFDLMTQRCLKKNGREILFCYEFGYRAGVGRRVEVVRLTHPLGIFR